ncbi:contact-dependent growth inhibition system immunity protein [Streptomyces sp. NPDC054842]
MGEELLSWPEYRATARPGPVLGPPTRPTSPVRQHARRPTSPHRPLRHTAPPVCSRPGSGLAHYFCDSTSAARPLPRSEGDRWPDPTGDATRLIRTAHALRRKPVGELTVEDMRLLIGQNEGLPHLLPLALEVLRRDPLAEGHMYEGDLLSAVLTRSPEVWSRSPELGSELRRIVSGLSDPAPKLKREVERFLAL